MTGEGIGVLPPQTRLVLVQSQEQAAGADATRYAWIWVPATGRAHIHVRAGEFFALGSVLETLASVRSVMSVGSNAGNRVLGIYNVDLRRVAWWVIQPPGADFPEQRDRRGKVLDALEEQFVLWYEKHRDEFALLKKRSLRC